MEYTYFLSISKMISSVACFCFVSAFLFVKGAETAAIETHKDFLSQAECDDFRLQHGPHVSVARDVYPVGRVPINAGPEIYNRILERLVPPPTASTNETTCSAFANLPEQQDRDGNHHVFLSKIVGTTALHRDQHVGFEEKRGQVLQKTEKVAFIFLDDHPDAYFSLGKDMVKAEKGKLVVFNGGEPHHTVLPSASSPVHLLGPFSPVNGRLSLVGTCTACLFSVVRDDTNGNGVFDTISDALAPNVLCELRDKDDTRVAAKVTNQEGSCLFENVNVFGLPLSIRFGPPEGKEVLIPNGGVGVFNEFQSGGQIATFEVLIGESSRCNGLLECFIYYFLFGWLLDIIGLW